MSKPLEQVLADWRGDASVLRARGHETDATLIENLCGEVAGAAEEFIRWLSEDDARLRSGLSRRSLRRRFRELFDAGHARYNAKGDREYRMTVIPMRAEVESARSAGRRGEKRRAS